MIKPDDPLLISCNFCIYVAICEEEVNWHMTEEHLTDDKLGFETDFPCDMFGRWLGRGHGGSWSSEIEDFNP